MDTKVKGIKESKAMCADKAVLGEHLNICTNIFTTLVETSATNTNLDQLD